VRVRVSLEEKEMRVFTIALALALTLTLFQYPERDLNPHNRNGHRILSPACLPFHHPGVYKSGRYLILILFYKELHSIFGMVECPPCSLAARCKHPPGVSFALAPTIRAFHLSCSLAVMQSMVIHSSFKKHGPSCRTLSRRQSGIPPPGQIKAGSLAGRASHAVCLLINGILGANLK
jgi:hypothetical protein